MKGNSIKTETYGLKSQKTLPPINELTAFENDLIELVKNIKFRTAHNQLQRTFKSDIKLIQQYSKTLKSAENIEYVQVNKKRVQKNAYKGNNLNI